jgi:hypothetical protein
MERDRLIALRDAINLFLAKTHAMRAPQDLRLNSASDPKAMG